MQKQTLLYKSKGITSKFKQIYQIVSLLFLILGGIMVFLPALSDAPSIFFVLGLIYIAFALLLPKAFNNMSAARLFIFDDHIELVATYTDRTDQIISLSRLFNSATSTNNLLLLQYDQISDVKKTALSNSFASITLTSGDMRYTTMVRDIGKAYQIICDKVYGETAAKECIQCRHEISATTEICPHCGHMTRYGKAKTEEKKTQTNLQKQYILAGIGAVICFIGLVIFVPAMIELEEIRSYAGLYSAFRPTDAKMLVVKVISGLFLSILGASFCIANLFAGKIFRR